MNIAKNTREARRAINGAQDILCFSLSNNFSGRPLAEKPVIWGGEIVNNQYTKLIEVSQAEFLARELAGRNAKLTAADSGKPIYTLHIHSNLWYEFRVCNHDFVLQADDMRECRKCGKRATL